MPGPVSEQHFADLLRPFVTATWPVPLSLSDPEQVLQRILPPLQAYLELLLRWNARTNLTAVREPEEIITRHFGESLFAALRLPTVVEPGATVLDYGSGAGFPGIPLQLLLPVLPVTLAESQGKKASFLREVVRVLDLPSEVWSRRVDELPASRSFDVITLRAVDSMQLAVREARERLSPAGWLLQLTSSPEAAGNPMLIPQTRDRWVTLQQLRPQAETMFHVEQR